MIFSSFEQPADASHWLTLVEFRAEYPAGDPAGAAELSERLGEALTPLSIPPGRLERIQAAVGSAVQRAAARRGGGPLSLSLRICLSRQAPGEGPRQGPLSEKPPRSMRETVPIWTGGPLGWGFFLIEQSAPAPAPGEGEPAGQPAGHLIQLFLYPEGGQAGAP